MYWRNWKRYWKEQLTHVAVSAFAGWLASSGHPAAGATVAAYVIARQGLEFAKRRDTVGIDMAYHLAGLLIGIIIGLVMEAL